VTPSATCWHEAAHAVVARLLGAKSIRASVIPNAESLGRVRYRRINGSEESAMLRNHLLVALAGEIPERPAVGKPLPSATSAEIPEAIFEMESAKDWAMDILGDLLGDEAAALRALDGMAPHLLADARRLVKANWREITELARRLDNEGEFSMSESLDDWKRNVRETTNRARADAGLAAKPAAPRSFLQNQREGRQEPRCRRPSRPRCEQHCVVASLGPVVGSTSNTKSRPGKGLEMLRAKETAKTLETDAKGFFARRKKELKALEDNAAEAVRLQSELQHLRRDRDRYAQKAENAAALGDKKFEIIVQGHYLEALGVSADVLVGATVETGNQIAARVAGEVAELDREIKAREARIAELLGTTGQKL
jgi:hypothetical protein